MLKKWILERVIVRRLITIWERLAGKKYNYIHFRLERLERDVSIYKKDYRENISIVENICLENCNSLNQFKIEFNRELKNRLLQMKKFQEKENQRFKITSDNLKELSASLYARDTLVEDRCRSLDQRLDNFVGRMHKVDVIKENLERYLEKFELIESLANSVEEKYNRYLSKLKKDISEFAETHHVPKRMASLETRITLLEISHNGSGRSDPSGSLGKNKD